MKKIMQILAPIYIWIFLLPLCSIADSQSGKVGDSENSRKPAEVCVVRIDGMIASPQLSILKRAIREAKLGNAKLLVIDINTPGGDLATTLKMMETLSDFKGETACYINTDAISAGSFIAAACNKIYFAPNGVMGAAEAVSSGGKDIDKSMARKITSFIGAKVRSICGENSRRAQILRAMNDPEFELKIGDKVLKKSGELLTLTAKEAAEKIDAKPLLSDGTEKNLQGVVLSTLNLPQKDVHIRTLKITWAEKIAKLVTEISPILLGIGFFLLVMELKSGGFGLMGICAVIIILSVFAGANLSGIAGYEEIALFLLGALMIIVELIFFPGLFFLSIPGAIMAVGAIIWALADIIPSRGLTYNTEAITFGAIKFLLSIPIAAILVVIFGGLVKRSPLWKKMQLASCASDSRAPSAFDAVAIAGDNGAGVPLCGQTLSDLTPSGRIEIDGKIFDATAEFGHIARGTKIVVSGKKDFNFIVKKI